MLTQQPRSSIDGVLRPREHDNMKASDHKCDGDCWSPSGRLELTSFKLLTVHLPSALADRNKEAEVGEDLQPAQIER